ncbi:MAG: PLP-dependent aminotransferase family protein [Clostridiaceae bacterium]|jgi:2-aminoadipate transaminase|nr:PLP-dependent aminotransferase family protein [Clostridiaceae bacterium]
MVTALFAERIEYIKASEIRELLKITERPEVISFAGGLPAPELFPVQAMAELSGRLIRDEGWKALQYSTTEGFTPLREKISCRMKKVFQAHAEVDEIMITSGSQQALDFVGKVLINPGDEVFMESPSYLGAINAFRPYGPKFVEVETDAEGMIPEALNDALKRAGHPKFIYIIPDFQNPTGRTWSIRRRKALMELASKYGVLVVEDNPYGELRYEGDMLPAVKSMDTEGWVVYLGTFSKTLCPGMRIGWIAAHRQLIEKFVLVKQGADLHTSTISQMQINLYIGKEDFDGHIQTLRQVYRKRRDAITRAMERYFPEDACYNNPEGGLFTWVELPGRIDAAELLKEALNRNVAFVPGAPFFPCTPKKNTLRLNFSNMPENRIEQGIVRLADAMVSLQ